MVLVRSYCCEPLPSSSPDPAVTFNKNKCTIRTHEHPVEHLGLNIITASKWYLDSVNSSKIQILWRVCVSGLFSASDLNPQRSHWKPITHEWEASQVMCSMCVRCLGCKFSYFIKNSIIILINLTITVNHFAIFCTFHLPLVQYIGFVTWKVNSPVILPLIKNI